MIAFYVKGWGLIIPVVVYEPTSVTNTVSQYKVYDDTGTWQVAGDALLYNPTIGGFNTFVHITAAGTYTDGHAYLCTAGMIFS